MQTGATGYMKQKTEQAHDALCERRGSRSVESSTIRDVGLPLLGIMALGAAIAAGVYWTPHLIRYLKTRQM